jgi:aconitate hydratase
VGPAVAAATAIAGVLTDPRTLGEPPLPALPDSFHVNDNMFLQPAAPAEASSVSILRGPNIAPLPAFPPLPNALSGEVLLKVGDNITTDHIMPAGAKVLPLRSNVPEISKFVFEAVDPTFARRAKSSGGGFVVGGDNYGQGSSREHAALAPKYLGVKAVITRSFARIHLANLINFGIVPLTFKNPADYDAIALGDQLEVHIGDLRGPVVLKNLTKGTSADLAHTLSSLDADVLKAGGKLPWIKTQIEARL